MSLCGCITWFGQFAKIEFLQDSLFLRLQNVGAAQGNLFSGRNVLEKYLGLSISTDRGEIKASVVHFQKDFLLCRFLLAH